MDNTPEYKRTVYETSRADKAKVLTHFAHEGLPGRGFTCLLIGGTLQDGSKELLELRFHSDFLPHLKRVVEGLEELAEDEKDRTEVMIAKAEKDIGSLEVDDDEEAGEDT